MRLVGARRLDESKLPRQYPRTDVWLNGEYCTREEQAHYKCSDKDHPVLQEGGYAFSLINSALNEAQLSATPCCKTCVYGQIAPELLNEWDEGVCERYPYKEGNEIRVFKDHYCGEYAPKNRP